MLDYAALAALAAVVREGSLEKAAQALGVTPSAISQRVRGLEERLGAVLVVRGQPCTPTEPGARLCAHWRQVALLEEALVAGMPRLGEPGQRHFAPSGGNQQPGGGEPADEPGVRFCGFHPTTRCGLDLCPVGSSE